MNNLRKVVILFSTCCLLTLVVMFRDHSEATGINPRRDWMKFAPKHNFTECIDLFSSSTEAVNFQMSTDYQSVINGFLQAIETVSREIEGHSYQYKKHTLTLHYLAKELDFVKTVCETGFNAGHSALNFLTAKPSINLHSFDIGRWNYTRPMAVYLKRKFGDRFHLYLGDSTQTLPAFVAGNSGRIVCDLIHVDGGHIGEVPLRDLENFSLLANLKNNIVFIDNFDMWAISSAWKKLADSGVLQHFFSCLQRDGPWQVQLAAGMYVKRHTSGTLESAEISIV